MRSDAATVAEYVSELPEDRRYLMGVYGDEGTATWFRERWARTGKRLDMGKSCVRFRRLDDLPLDLVGEAIGRMSLDEFVALVERSRA